MQIIHASQNDDMVCCEPLHGPSHSDCVARMLAVLSCMCSWVGEVGVVDGGVNGLKMGGLWVGSRF